MVERPILFSASMVTAILDGRKTQTRRTMRPQPDHLQVHEHRGRVIYDGEHRMWCWKDLVLENIWDFPNGEDRKVLAARAPYGQPGDLLWVKESFSGPWGCRGVPPRDWPKGCPRWFWADGDPTEGDWTRPKPSIHMPRWASRITLQVTEVRVERLQDISDADGLAEGITCENVIVDSHGATGRHVEVTADRYFVEGGPEDGCEDAVSAYADLWGRINGSRSWDANPWIWAITFERIA